MSISQVEQLACFVHDATFEDLSPATLERFKLHVLDTLGCAVGALDSEHREPSAAWPCVPPEAKAGRAR